ncbi:TspO/MBR family protein [Tropicibacter sp. Alg240-R139]|uniref:TspO/MBR family protein n=1 Tax=Tropicibacter sp. Alg240-R139 TaxID=2305991 RepID=UPI0013DFB3ED|nr:TspO/MBR family protein [Tropicibacter sp. Alg240-R139]
MSASTLQSNGPSRTVRFAFLVLVMGGGITIGIMTAPGDWYVALNKPWFNPPNWVFGPAWTLLYLLIAMAGWRSFAAGPLSRQSRLWWIQLGLNFAWSPVFFFLQQPVFAFAVIAALLFAIALFIRISWISDRTSALAMVPYLAWVSFASLLNLSIILLN